MTIAEIAATGSARLTNAAGGSRSVTISRPGSSGHAYGHGLDKFVALAEQELAVTGAPGMTFSFADAEGFTAHGSLGWADADRQIPVGPSHLFQIGSISKSFAALCVYRLADEGKIDLDAPLSRYLPEVPLPAEAILVQQVLSHTAGLPRSASISPRVPGERLWTGFTPGSKYYYSNLGYELLGKVVEKISGKPYALALRDLVIKPLGITGMKEVIQPSDRAGYAVGYCPADMSGPNMMRTPLGQIWADLDTAAGSIGATADAMTPYLQYLIAVGRGLGAPLFSNATAKRFTTMIEPGATFENGEGYANGLQVIDLDGHVGLQHTGGTLGFASCMTVDPATGVGCFVSVNCLLAGYRPESLSRYACALLRQARDGRDATGPLPTTLSKSVEDAKHYTGTYIGPDGQRFDVQVLGNRLSLTTDGHEGRMDPLGEHQFLSDHPRFDSHVFQFEHSGDTITAAWYGAVLYGRGAPLPQPAVPQEIASLQGDYYSSDMYTGRWRCVIAQGASLVVENINFYRTKDIMHKDGDHWLLEGSESSCERVRFEAEVNGVPQCLSVSGRDLWRIQRV